MLDRDFGKYRLIRRLGRGGMADVYLARDTARNVEIALKVVEQKPDRDSREICEAECRGAALQDQFSRVDSHVPAVHAYATIDEYFCIDMEYVDGEDLAERIERGPLAAETAAWVASEVCEFLQKAHEFEATLDDRKLRGIIHGDIKPKNVRLNLAGHVKVLDFGIAKGLALSRKLTRNDFGSLAYLSPERLESGEVDIHVDFWSVGILLYEMLSGTPPFEAETNSKLEARIRSRQPPPPLPDSVPPALVRLVLKLLAGDLHRRYQSAGDIRADLDAFRAGRETRADREWLAESEHEATRRTVLEGTPLDTNAEITRRTIEPEHALDLDADSEATRRTLAGPPPVPRPGGEAAEAVAVPVAPTAWALRLTRARRFAAIAVVLGSIGVVGNEAIVWSAAKKLRADVATAKPPEMHGVWNEYQDLSHRSLLGIGLVGVRGQLKDRLLEQAERVIGDYRQDAPVVREAQWRDAAGWLTDALRLDPSDKRLTARLRYCEGQVQRITGEARKRGRQAAAQPLHDAVVDFEDAARLDNRWPDPYLGLARTYVYGLEDLDKAIAALHEAETRGYRPGNRELVQIGDGYRSRADRMRREAGSVRGLAQERDCLQKAADDYRHALEIYGKAIGFGEVSAVMRQVQARLDEVQKRLDGLTAPTEG
ncbi:MAG TPA: protein kinase [Vicinamibacterales bacterium]|jgi:serine/threonine protein kinase